MQRTLGDGTVAASATAIYTAASSDSPSGERVTLSFCNTASTSETLVVTFKNNGGTSRRIRRSVLAQNEQVVINGITMKNGDVLLATTTNASAVDYVVQSDAGGAFAITEFNASGAVKQATTDGGAVSFSDGENLTFGSDNDLTLEFNATDNVVTNGPTSGLWAGAPSVLDPDPSKFYVLFDDFLNPASATASAYHAYTSNDDGGTGTNAFQDAVGGIYNVVTAAADNDYHAMSSVAENWKLAAGKKLWFEARFKLAEANTNESAWWFGLTDTLTTGGFQADAAGPLASYDGILVWKDEATMAIDFETSNAGTQATTTNMATFVTNTWTRIGFYFDGTATTGVVTPYFEVSGVAGTAMTAGTSQNITLAGMDEMHMVFGVKAGPTAGAETLQVDYIKVIQLR